MHDNAGTDGIELQQHPAHGSNILNTSTEPTPAPDPARTDGYTQPGKRQQAEYCPHQLKECMSSSWTAGIIPGVDHAEREYASGTVEIKSMM